MFKNQRPIQGQSQKARYNCEIEHAELLRLIHYDPESGCFTWKVNRGRNCKAGMSAGTVRHGYITITVNQRFYMAHRLAWFYVHGVWPDQEVDHRDVCPTNNAIANLRLANRSMNVQNIRTARRTNMSSGLLGAHLHRCGRWMANIGINGKMKYLGLFDTKEEAHEAYLNAKRRLHEGCLV